MKHLYLQQGNLDVESFIDTRAAMKNFECKGKQVEFRTVTGEVAGAHKRSDTIVSGSGGGGSTYNGHGYTSPVQISSKIVVKQEFFLKPADGNQIPVQLSDEDIPLSDRQNMTMISGHAGNAVGKWTHLVNHDAALYWKLGDVGAHAVVWGLVRNPLFSFLIGVAIWIAIGYAVSGSVGFIGMVAFWVYEWINLRNVSKALRNHFDELGREMLRKDAVSS
ncbi:hypothetical protein [Thiobacillus sp.]